MDAFSAHEEGQSNPPSFMQPPPQDRPFFEQAESWQGARPGYAFKLGHLGLGYYVDSGVDDTQDSNLLTELRPKLPERWRNCSTLRQERLVVDPASGAGMTLEHCEFGFKITGVDASPGQRVAPDDVIVAVEGRLFVGLSAPQMQASFIKRRVHGARLQVASLQEIAYLNTLDPSIIEGWDPTHQCTYYFSKKTGKSAWRREELEQEHAAASASSSSSGAAPAHQPVDLASFLSHGFAKPKEPAKPKKRKAAANSAAGAEGQDESDMARAERQRWREWNDGGQGGYTEQFLEKYKNCQSNPAKPKDDKRLKGSVGPGHGLEYVARWTGSKNSFN